MTAERGGPRGGQPTIRDIARRAGVSTATVSRAFNQPDRVKPETRARILDLVRELHYVSDGLAAGLVSRRSRTLGLIIPTVMNSIYAFSTQAVQKAAQEAGYSVLVGVSEFSPALERTLVRRLIERRVDGLILTGGNHEPDTIETVSRNGVPAVITWKHATTLPVPTVSFDNREAACKAVTYLIGLGHRRIGLVCGRSDVNDRALDRRRAYEACLAAHGIAVDPALIFERDFEMMDGADAMARMLANERPPTAVFCANDIQAIGALAACRAAGLSVPGDVSVIGFDDLPIASYLTPTLTTVRVPAGEMGRTAARALIARIERGTPLTSVRLPTKLVIRETTGV